MIAFGSMAVGMPFTLQYAREQVDPTLWQTRAFVRTNYVIMAVWGLAFLVAALAGGYGDLVLRNPNNIWTGWIIQILAIVAALRFTGWYPEVVRARATREAVGQGPEPPRTAGLLLPLAGLLVPIGIAVLVFDHSVWWLGVALVVAGGFLTEGAAVAYLTPRTRRRRTDVAGPNPQDLGTPVAHGFAALPRGHRGAVRLRPDGPAPASPARAGEARQAVQLLLSRPAARHGRGIRRGLAEGARRPRGPAISRPDPPRTPDGHRGVHAPGRVPASAATTPPARPPRPPRPRPRCR